MAPQKIPGHWDKDQRYEYRKHAGTPSTQKLIDIFYECIDILKGKKPIPPPYADKDRIRKKAVVLRHIIVNEREVNLLLAKQDYEMLEKQMRKI
ncbi:MAG: hypothetical protein WC459_01170 [Patescibacteria group bacterium]